MPDALPPHAAPFTLAPFTLASPALLAAAAGLALVAVAFALFRRVALPRGAAALMAIGLACLCLGAGGLTWNRRQVGRLAVVVDVSPSTALATFRDPDVLAGRLGQLIGDTPYTLYRLEDGVARATSQRLEDLPALVDSRRTSYAPPPAADAVVLFSDAQFAPPAMTAAAATTAAAAAAAAVTTTPPAAPQTFVVADPALERPADAAIERLEVRGDTAVATVRNGAGAPRQVKLDGTDVENATVEPGRFVVTGRIAPGRRRVVTYLHARDPWHGNDLLAVRVPPPRERQKWWIGGRPPPPGGGWVHIAPADAPTDLSDHLAAGVVVLDNVPADALAPVARGRLQQYVRDLGGGVLILGGDGAFAAGGYAGSSLEQLSPLASTPPEPAAQWLILADSSGSMARARGDNSRWNFAARAVAAVVPLLPADDALSVGNFSQGVRWWVAGRRVRDAQAGVAPPKDLRPHGPTNLAAALRLVAETADGSLPTNLLLVTDAEANIANADALADALAAKRVRVSVLAGEAVPAGNPLHLIAQRTGGRLTGQSDPRRWAGELKQLVRAASVPWLERRPMTVHFTDAGPDFPPRKVEPWNRTWVKRDATELAVGVVGAPDGGGADGGAGGGAGERVPAVAAWNVGTGAVIAAAFTPAPQVTEALAERVAAPPRDPRFRVIYDAGRELRVTLDAIDGERGYMNGLAPRLEISPDATRPSDAVVMAQTAPGRYEAAIPAPQHGGFLTVRLSGRVIDRFALAGRYPPEFEAIGNDRAAMEHLARATGGAVVEPTHTSPIDFRWPRRPVPLAPYLAAAGAAFVAAALVRWRM